MTNETKSMLDSIAKKETLSANNSIYGINIPCWTYYKKIGDVVTGKYYFVDLTDPEVKKIMENGFFPVITKAQDFLFDEEYYLASEEVRNNNNLIFIADEKTIAKYFQVEKNFEYIRKRFIKEKDLELFLSTLESKDEIAYSSEFVFKGKPYNLKKFNCIYGSNGSGKTQMMEAISKQFNSPLYSANMYSSSTKSDLKYMINNLDRNILALYYKRLWDFSSRTKITDKIFNLWGYGELTMLYIAAVLAKQEEENNQILLIDDIFWENFDSKRTLNAIEVLGDVSTPTVVTAFTEHPKELIRKKILGSNIIEL